MSSNSSSSASRSSRTRVLALMLSAIPTAAKRAAQLTLPVLHQARVLLLTLKPHSYTAAAQQWRQMQSSSCVCAGCLLLLMPTRARPWA
jgi:hypothetical protein